MTSIHQYFDDGTQSSSSQIDSDPQIQISDSESDQENNNNNNIRRRRSRRVRRRTGFYREESQENFNPDTNNQDFDPDTNNENFNPGSNDVNNDDEGDGIRVNNNNIIINNDRESEESSALAVASQPRVSETEEGSVDRIPTPTASCVICMEPLTFSGKHRICFIRCGHVFGESCIKRWIRSKTTSTCPQCNGKCKLRDVKPLYAELLTVVDDGMLQEVTVLRDENEKLKLENRTLKNENKEILKTYNREIEGLKVQNRLMSEEIKNLQRQVQDNFTSSSYDQYGTSNPTGSSFKRRHTIPEFFSQNNQGFQTSNIANFGPRPYPQYNFNLLTQLRLQGAKFFDIDSVSQMLLISQKASELGSVHFLTKMSLLFLSGGEQINLPPDTGAVRDIHIAPSGSIDPGRLALVASKRLSLISFQSNNVSLSYNLQAPAWSCAWDCTDPNRVYAGLQNGSIVVFDIRNTRSHLQSFESLNRHPVHALHSIVTSSAQNSGNAMRAVMSASFSGPSVWFVDEPSCRPCPIPGLENKGVCISLAYNSSGNAAVASFRPKAGLQSSNSLCNQSADGIVSSQLLSSQIPFNSQIPSNSPYGGGSISKDVTVGNHFVLATSDTPRQIDGDTSTHAWYCNNGMTGNVSAHGMTKSTIFTSFPPAGGPAYMKSFFAYGDELKKSVSIHDMDSLSVTQLLHPHENQITDLRHCDINGKRIFGSISERTLQLYTF